MVVANMKDLFLGIGYFLLGHILVWYQLNGQFLWKSFRDNEWAVAAAGFVISFFLYGELNIQLMQWKVYYGLLDL